MRRRRIAQTVACPLVTLALVALVPGRSSASPPSLLAAGTVEAITAPLTGTAPADGRLRGPSVQADVTQVAWPASTDGYVASTGQRLVAFELSLSESVASAQGASAGPTLWLSVDGVQHALPLSALTEQIASASGDVGTGEGGFVASVPAPSHAVELSLVDGGFTQSFDLWTLRRTTSAPTVLYADPSGSAVSVAANATRTLALSPSIGAASSSIVQASGATLEAFNPGNGASAPLAHAFLVLSLSSGPPQLQFGSPSWGTFYSGMTPIAGSAITFTARGHRYVAQRSHPIPQADNPNGTSDDGLVDATYAFLVPDTVHGGTVSIGPATTTATAYQGFVGGNTVSVHVAGPERFRVGWTRFPSEPSQPIPSWVSAPVPPTGVPGHAGSSHGVSIWLAVLVLALAAAAALAVRRHTRRAPSEEVPATPHEPTPHVPVAPRVAPSGPRVLKVGVLGPVLVDPVEGELTEFGRAFVAYLVLHADRPRTVDDVQTALWPTVGPRGDVSRKTFLNQVSAVRRCVGARHLPGSKGIARYALVDATCDWDEFRSRTSSLPDDPALRAARLDAALDLVRGVPFESEVSPAFEWADARGLRSAMARAIVTAAVELHALCVRDSDLAGADHALRRGLRASPYEPVLWDCLADVVQATGDPGEEARFWRDASALLDTEDLRRLHERVLG